MNNGMRSLLALLTLAASMTNGQADLTLVENGQHALPIYTPTNWSKKTPGAIAAGQLAFYLNRISGCTGFVVRPLPADPPSGGIFVGAVDPAMKQDLPTDSFRLRADDRRLDIAGGSPQGTAYGVYAFLQDSLGCRWWSRTEEDIPSNRPTLTLPALDRTVQPAFIMHDVYNVEAQTPENQFHLKSRSKSTEEFIGGHSLNDLLKPYYEAHPDILPQGKNGVRKFNKLHFCYLATNIVDYLTEALDKKIAACNTNVRDFIYFAGMGDWYGGMCECPACKAVYEEETWTTPDGHKLPGYTATLLRMINQTAERLEQRYPGVRVGTFAYMSLEAPPAKTVPRANVVIRVPRLRHCTVHPAETCRKNRGFKRNLERWCELAPGRVYVWEYGASFKNFLYPFPCLHSMADNLKYYHQMGVRGIEIQGNYGSTGGDLAVLKNYVWGKLFWDPALDTQSLLTEFCRGYYGPAADGMRAYVDALEQSVHSPTNICADEFANFPFLTPALKQQLADLREQALTQAGADTVARQRVEEATIGLEAQKIWKEGPLEEQDGKLVRTDLGGYSYDRAVTFVARLRGAAASEWSGHKASTMGFLTWHGGPLVSFTNGPTVYTFAPVLNGRLRQITYDGKRLLTVPTPKEKIYPMGGGSAANNGTRCMQLDGEPTPTRARFYGEAGLSLWSRAGKQHVWQTVVMGADGFLSITGTATYVGGDADYEKKNTTITTEYIVSGDPAAVKVEYLTADQQWLTATVATDTNDTERLHLTGLRVTLPDKGCQVIDLYPFPNAGGPASNTVADAAADTNTPPPAGPVGRLFLDTQKRVLTTTVHTPAAPTPAKRESPFYGRRLQVLPLTDAARTSTATPANDSSSSGAAQTP